MRTDTILIGKGRHITTISREEWESELSAVPQHFEKKLSFMTVEHHLVRCFVVRELPLTGEPLSIELIAKQVGLPASRVTAILDDLEHLLVRRTFQSRIAQKLINLRASS